MANNQGFWQQLRTELRPVATHAVIVVFLQGSLLTIGLMTRLLESLFPDRKPFFEYIELVDIWTSLALLCMFAAYTLIIVARTLWRGLWE